MLPDIPAARKHAVRYFGEMLQGDPCTFWNGEEWKDSWCDAIQFRYGVVQVKATVVQGSTASLERLKIIDSFA